MSEKSIGKFLDDFVAGKVDPSVKSEPIPEKNDGPVTIVVAKNYNDIVLDDSKDVLIEFYAPWCGHCKALAPKYEELGSLYSGNNNVVVAKVDATTNDVPDEIQGFPTIKLYPAKGKDSPLEYSGSRTVEDLANFIRDKGYHAVDGYAAKEDAEEVETEGMPQQAPAATKAAEKAKEGVKGKIMSKAGEAAEVVKTAIMDSDGDQADTHDEL